ncbi:MAG: Zn-dependent carboxypeptidase [uncultured Acidilobus sp. CIS]|nr:MAG: Zn-dependent carboxypeptidase [uncultured Acidilobus sp. CIS]
MASVAKFENPVIKELLERYRRIWSLGHAMGLMGWDEETYMPSQGVVERATAMAELRTLYQELITGDQFVSLVERASKQEGLNEYERGVVRVLNREITILKKIPPSLNYELTKTSQEAFIAWREAKAKSDFQMFRPYLEKIVELNRQMAEKLGYEENPYDALLDLHEEGLRTRDVRGVFSVLEPAMKRVLDRVTSEGYFSSPSPLEEAKYEEAAMRRVNEAVLSLLGYPTDRARLDVSPHPFTIDMGVNDVRITTRYEGFDFKRSLFSVVHEFGHATYELQVDPELDMTPIGTGASLGVHEGQSRFWENVVGRTLSFVRVIRPILDRELGFTRAYSDEELYRYFAHVRPSLIRTEADEVTYNFHILLRYELEVQMLNREVKVQELPEIWNERMESLLGVRPKNDAEGVLQDVHWAHGTLGYFPTYTLGNIVASMMLKDMNSHGLRLSELVEARNFSAIKDYLRDRVHRWGSAFAPKELLRRAFGREYSAEDLVDYLERKYIRKEAY